MRRCSSSAARAFSLAVAALLPITASATAAIPVPEPGSWWLMGIAGVAAVVATIRNRRK
jgi:hypothetical protein